MNNSLFRQVGYIFEAEEKEKRRRGLRKIKEEWFAEARAIRDADPSRKTLLREAKRASLERVEEAARTEEDFERVQKHWDVADAIDKDRVSKHYADFFDELGHYLLPEKGRIIPIPFEHICWPQLLRGDFIEYMHDCPHELHELTSSRPVYDFTKKLKDNDKEILYYRVIRQYTPQYIAMMRKQTDRNIRKVYAKIIRNLRRQMYLRLVVRFMMEEPLTLEQKQFCATYPETVTESEKARVSRQAADDLRYARQTVLDDRS